MTNTTEEKILSMLSEMQADITGMKADIARLETKVDSLETKIDALAEEEEMTRGGVDTLLEWADEVSRAVRFPLPRVDERRRA